MEGLLAMDVPGEQDWDLHILIKFESSFRPWVLV
jgi:hypothetical protein